MDISSDLRDSFIRPPSLIMNPLRGSVDGCCTQSGGLMRYHSAPSSTFAALLEPDLFSANDAAELVHFLEHNNVNDFGSFGDAEFPLKQHRKQTSSSKNMQPQQAYSAHNDVLLQHSVPEAVTFQEHIGQGPLCAIFEHAGDEHCLPQPIQGNSTANASNGAAIHSDSQYRSNLIRHSSLPTDFVSRLAMADMSERPMGSQQATSHVQSSSQQAISRLQTTSAGTTDNLGGKVYLKTSRMSPRGVPVIKGLTDDSLPCKKDEYQALDNELNQPCGLLRQSSSPAGLLSQLSLDEFGSPADKAVSPSTPSSSSGRWDEASMDFAMHNIAALSQRKRGREIDARLLKSLPTADLTVIDQITSPLNLYSAVAASNNDMTDAVLCKSRAKRGCATHPRSIAERVRRTKISERIKKLQDLVPNLDKQAHTADMLDEIVEYVKLLQRRVEELSNQSHVCNGTCQKKEDNPVQA